MVRPPPAVEARRDELAGWGPGHAPPPGTAIQAPARRRTGRVVATDRARMTVARALSCASRGPRQRPCLGCDGRGDDGTGLPHRIPYPHPRAKGAGSPTRAVPAPATADKEALV